MDLFAPRHLLIVLVIVLLVFGTKKLKSIGSDLGSAVRGFKDSMREAEQDTTTEIHNPGADPKQLGAGAQAPGEKKPAAAPADKTNVA